MNLAKDCQEDFEAAEKSCGENGVTSDAHVDGTCRRFFGHGEPFFFQVILFFYCFFWRREGLGGGGFMPYIPLRASSKQWVGSQCEVKITTV